MWYNTDMRERHIGGDGEKLRIAYAKPKFKKTSTGHIDRTNTATNNQRSTDMNDTQYSTIDNTNRAAVCMITYPHNNHRAIVDVPHPTTLDPHELADIIATTLTIPPVQVDVVDHIYILDDEPKQRVLDYIAYIDIEDADRRTISNVMSASPHGVTIYIDREKSKNYPPDAKPWRAMCYYDGVAHHIDVDCHANDYTELVSRLSTMGYEELPMVVRWVWLGVNISSGRLSSYYYTLRATDDEYHYHTSAVRKKIEKKYTPTRDGIPYHIDFDVVGGARWYEENVKGTPRAWRAIVTTALGARRWVYTDDIDVDQAIQKLKKGKHPVSVAHIRRIFWANNFN